MNITEAIKSGFKNHSNFKTRASRSEFWWFQLFLIIVSNVLAIFDTMNGSVNQGIGIGFLSGLFLLTTIIPNISVYARRLHDTGRSGWWQLIIFTGIGILFLFYWLLLEGDKNKNVYGDNPLN